MNILILNTLYYPYKVGGAEKSVQLLAEDLSKINHNVFVVSLTDKPSFNDVINGVKIYYLNLKNIYWPFDGINRTSLSKFIWHFVDTQIDLYKNSIEKIIEIEKPDVVHINNISGFSTQILKCFKKHHLPVVQTLRDYHYLCLKNTCYNNQRCTSLCNACSFASKFKIKRLNSYIDHVVGISDYIINKHQVHGLASNIPTTKIHNAVKTKEIKRSKNKIFANSPIVRFGYIGAITEAKGVEDMLKKMSDHKLRRFQFEVKLAGVGSQTYIDMLKEKFNDLKIHFMGYQDSDQFFNNIDALIVPSLWDEPFGRIVIEGAQYHLPIFVSRHGALPELKEKMQGIDFFNVEKIGEFLDATNTLDNHYNLEEFKSIKISESYERIFRKLI